MTGPSRINPPPPGQVEHHPHEKRPQSNLENDQRNDGVQRRRVHDNGDQQQPSRTSAGRTSGPGTSLSFGHLLRDRSWASFPSLPAGINTDDSDPLGPDRGLPRRTSIGASRNPPFGGGALSSPLIFLYRHYGIRIVGANHRKKKSLRNVGLPHPPLCPWGKKHAVLWGMKNTRIWPLKPAPKTAWPGTSNSRQSRPLPLA